MLCRWESADLADALPSNSRNHNQQSALAGHTNNHEALLVEGVTRVGDGERKGIIENAATFQESDSVLP